MATGSITVVRERMRNLHRRNKESADEAERKITLGIAAALIGWAERSKTIPLEWFGVPSKVVIAGIGYVLAYNSTGATRRLANAASDASITTYAYNAAKSANFIAGDGDVGSEVVEVQGDEI
jgi:hypothetical protein